MIILELNFEKEWRGGERQTIYTMQGFRNAGIETQLVCRKASSIEVQANKEGFVTHSFNSIFGVIFFLITNGKNYNFLHAQTSHILTYCIFTKFFHKRPVIFTRRVNFIQKGFLTKIKYHYTDKIIAISEAIKNTLTSFTNRNDIEVISDIVVQDVANISNVQSVIDGINIHGKYIIATTTALTKEKDPFVMIDAIKKLTGKRDDIVFLHFGAGNLKGAMIEKIEENNLTQTYFLIGFVKNIPDFFPFFNVFIMSSKEEGLGSSVLDAFINKIPVVATDAGGLKDLLKDGKGIACEIGDSNALAAGINILLEDAEKRNHYISNAFNYVNQFHSMKYITDQYIGMIKNITATK